MDVWQCDEGEARGSPAAVHRKLTTIEIYHLSFYKTLQKPFGFSPSSLTLASISFSPSSTNSPTYPQSSINPFASSALRRPAFIIYQVYGFFNFEVSESKLYKDSTHGHQSLAFTNFWCYVEFFFWLVTYSRTSTSS